MNRRRPASPMLKRCSVLMLVVASVAAAFSVCAAAMRDVDSVYAATYLGGIGEDGYRDTAILYESGGTILVAGATRSTDFPSMAGAYDETFNGDCDVFIARFDMRFSTLLAATFFGTGAAEGAWPGVSLVEDETGRIYVTAATTSADLPVTPGCYDATYNGGGDVFVASFSHDLDSLLACTYLGGSSDDGGMHIAVTSDAIYIQGSTRSANFPTTAGSYDRTINGGNDAFVSRLTRDLTSLTASTYLGGTYDDYGMNLLRVPGGEIYLTGITNTYGFPTTPGAYDRQVNSSGSEVDAFISKFSPDLSTLMASTFLGGTNTDFPYSLVLGSTGDIFVAGHVQSTDFPTTPLAYDQTYNSPPGDYDDAFISRLNPELSELIASTYLGASGWDWAITLLADGCGHLFVGGETQSVDFPTTPGAFAEAMHGDPPNQEGWISRLDEELTSLEASTYFGGAAEDLVSRIILGPGDVIFVSGGTGSSDFPVTSSTYDATFNGGGNRWGGDVILVRLDRLLTGHGIADVIDQEDFGSSIIGLKVAPNPIVSHASIEFALARPSHVTIDAFDVGGRRVATIAGGPMSTGPTSLTWDGQDTSGRRLSPGMYLLRIAAGDSEPASARRVTVW